MLRYPLYTEPGANEGLVGTRLDDARLSIATISLISQNERDGLEMMFLKRDRTALLSTLDHGETERVPAAATEALGRATNGGGDISTSRHLVEFCRMLPGSLPDRGFWDFC
jgi:hypothetical protein